MSLPVLNPLQFVHSAPAFAAGKTIYVNATSGSNGYDGQHYHKPVDTIDRALARCVSARGDVIVLLPGHTETFTAAQTIDVNGVTIIGVGNGTERPMFTGNGTIDCLSITANNVTIKNIQFGAPGTDAQTSNIDVVGTNCTLKNIEMVGSDTGDNIVDCITVTATADDLTIDGLYIHNSTVAVNSFISLEGAASRVTLKNIWCFGDVATAGIIDAAKIDYLFMQNVNIGVVGTTKPAATLDSNPEGMAVDCNFAGTHGTLATNANMGNLMRLFNVRVLEETDASAQGALIPAVDSE